MFKLSCKSFSQLATLTLLALVPACSSGGGGSAPTPGGGTPAFDLSGTWSITENIVAATGGCPTGVQPSYDVVVTQTGSALSVTAPSGTFAGTMSGAQLSWTGSYPEDGGTTTILSMNLTATDSTLSGSSEWRWSDGSMICTGTTQVSGTRLTRPLEALPTFGTVTFLLENESEFGVEAEADHAGLVAMIGDPGALEGEVLGPVAPATQFEVATGRWDLWFVRGAAAEALAGDDLPEVRRFESVEVRRGENVTLLVESID